MKLRLFLAGCAAPAAVLALAPPACAQSAGTPTVPYNIGNAVQSAEEARHPPLPRSAATPVLPQLVEPRFTLKDKETLLVRHFRIDGEHLVDEAKLRDLLAPYENRKLTIAEIYDAADKVTTLYRSQGYLVAKAYVPAQNARGGLLRIKVIPGRYGSITLNNKSLVRDSYLRGVIDHALGGSELIRKDPLERAMLLISDLAGAAMPRVAIGPGQRPETSDFVFSEPQGRRVDGYLLGDNYGAPFVGRDRVSGGFDFNSPFGLGDRFSAFGMVSEHDEILNGRISYSVPIGYDGLRAEIGAFRTTYALGGTYQDLEAKGTANGLTATLTYALKRQREDSIYLSANYTRKWLNDSAFGLSIANRMIDLGTFAVTRDTAAALFGLPLNTSTMLSATVGNVNFPDPVQKAENIAGADTVGQYWRINLSFNATLALTENLSFLTSLKAQKSLSGNLDSSEEMMLTGAYGVRSFDEGLAGDSGYLVTPELKYALPDVGHYRHAIGVFTDTGAVRIENASYTTTQKSVTQLNDFGLSYSGTYEYSPGRFLLLKSMVAHTYGTSDDTPLTTLYDRGTKGLVQVGLTF